MAQRERGGGGLFRKLPVHLRPLVTFLYYCGVRAGEARQI